MQKFKSVEELVNQLKPEKPAYLVKWTRFGTVTKYKWSGSAWNLQ